MPKRRTPIAAWPFLALIPFPTSLSAEESPFLAEATAPVPIIGPGTVFPNEPNAFLQRAFFNQSVIEIGGELFAYVQTLRSGDPGDPNLPWEICYHDQVVLFRNTASLEGATTPFTPDRLISPCDCTEFLCDGPDAWLHGLGNVILSQHDGRYYVFLERIRQGVDWSDGDFVSFIYGVSDDGLNWSYPFKNIPLLKQSTVCTPTCEQYSIVSPVLTAEADQWWGFFSWGQDSVFPNKVGSLRIYPDSTKPNGFRTEILTGGSWAETNSDGTFSALPDNVGRAGGPPNGLPSDLLALGQEKQLWWSTDRTDTGEGCTGDDLPFGSVFQHGAAGLGFLNELSDMDSRVRPNPTSNASGNTNPVFWTDQAGRIFLFSASTERVCEEEPTAWPPNGNTGWGSEIVTSIYTDSTFEDYFTPTSTRTDASMLDGTSLEVGGATWNASSAIVLDDGGISNQGLEGSFAGSFLFSGSPRPDETIWEIEVDIDIAGSEWFGLGFSASANGLPGDGQAWVLIHQNGTWRIRADGLGETVATGSTSDLLVPGLNRIRLRYDSVGHRSGATINGVRVAANEEMQHIPTVTHLTLQFWDPSGAYPGKTRLDRLKVRTIPASIFADGFEGGSLLAWDLAIP